MAAAAVVLMGVGTYNKFVTLARAPQTTPDSDGFFEALDPAGWWCAIQPLEPTLSDGTRTSAYRVTGRYHPQMTVDVRLLYGTRELFVKGVQDVNEAHREMVLYCEEVTA